MVSQTPDPGREIRFSGSVGLRSPTPIPRLEGWSGTRLLGGEEETAGRSIRVVLRTIPTYGREFSCKRRDSSQLYRVSDGRSYCGHRVRRSTWVRTHPLPSSDSSVVDVGGTTYGRGTGRLRNTSLAYDCRPYPRDSGHHRG